LPVVPSGVDFLVENIKYWSVGFTRILARETSCYQVESKNNWQVMLQPFAKFPPTFGEKLQIGSICYLEDGKAAVSRG